MTEREATGRTTGRAPVHDSPTMPAATCPFSWEEVRQARPTILHAGQWANATVLRARVQGEEWAIKTYRDAHALYRNTFGRFWSRHEYRVVTALQGLPGIPRNPCLLDASTFCCGYETGRTLVSLLLSEVRARKGSPPVTARQGNPVRPSNAFFRTLESTVQAMHARGIVHLDLRNGRNILLLENGSPLLLDFQSCLNLRRLPPPLRRMLTYIDLSGVYKWWYRLNPETMDRARFNRLQAINRTRILWPFKGYGTWLRLWRAKSYDRPDKHTPA